MKRNSILVLLVILMTGIIGFSPVSAQSNGNIAVYANPTSLPEPGRPMRHKRRPTPCSRNTS